MTDYKVLDVLAALLNTIEEYGCGVPGVVVVRAEDILAEAGYHRNSIDGAWQR